MKGQNVFDAIAAYKAMRRINHLEFNYPKYIAGYDLEEIKKAVQSLKVNGFVVRWRGFLDGNSSNQKEELRQKAIQIAKDATEICRKVCGNVIIL